MELLTTAQMRAAEHAAIAGGQVTGLELMERAGRGVVEAVFAQWPALAAAPGHAVLLCGPGNNGGDGFVVARLLAERGWSADVFLYGSAARLPPDAAETCRLWQEIGVVRPWHPEDVRRARGDLFVDALFGAGLSRGLPEEIAAPLTDLCADLCATPGAAPGADGQTGARMVAVDAPSGLCLDSGRNLNAGTGRDAVLAALTVTFHRPRPGHFIEEGPRHCGALRCVDIGLGPDALTGAAGAPGVAGPSPGPGATGPGSGAAGIALASAPLPEDLRKQNAAHKYTHGHALVLSGGVGKGGAARLAARGSLRIGAGLVTLGCPP
ncbi:MAG: NAD(P)H-hydrate epimerase, partial [Pseudomonadota bacterium]